MNTKVIAVCNQKGGVGKTTATVNLGIGLARAGKNVLLIDCDPQGSLTTSLGFDPDMLPVTLAQGLQDAMQGLDNEIPLIGEDSIIQHHDEGIDLVAANIGLAATETALVTAMSRETTMKRFLKDRIRIYENYDYVLLDCLPSLGMIMQNALVAADKVIIPVTPNYLSATGMMQLFDTINRVRAILNSNLEIGGIFINIFDKRQNLANETIEAITENFGSDVRVFDTRIPRAVKAAEAPVVGESIYKYNGSGKVAIAYKELTDEVLKYV